jgi:hypothetical protein
LKKGDIFKTDEATDKIDHLIENNTDLQNLRKPDAVFITFRNIQGPTIALKKFSKGSKDENSPYQD